VIVVANPENIVSLFAYRQRTIGDFGHLK